MNEQVETSEITGSRRIRLGPNAMRIAAQEGGDEVSAQSLEAAIARMETALASKTPAGSGGGQKLDRLSNEVQELLEFRSEVRNNFLALRHLLALLLAEEDDQIQQLEIMINQRLEETSPSLPGEKREARPNLSELARAYFGENRAATEMDRRDRNLSRIQDRERSR